MFNTAFGNNNIDTLTDFTSKTDVVQLSKSIFTAFGSTGALTSNNFWSAAGATSGQDSTDRIIYNTTTGGLYYDADGYENGLAVQIAIVGSQPAMKYADFAVVS